ncbi:LD-carboxypeptidase [Roseivirga sp.]|uniref:S66 peptidase family protein n=1 Tax=Roseivirga sp. TaxID=1964215 RepID=UPI002B279816|nr:LD-carboxypeptidase [Roseivirga sp.]
MLIPPLLSQGDKIAIVAPAKKIQSDLTFAVNTLTEWGLTPVLGVHVLATDHYFAGTDSQRLDDLQGALDDPEIKAILIARGGYGTTRILEQINWSNFLENPKWICGFSDITSLITELNNRSVACIHGPMAVTLDWDEQATLSLKAMLFEGKVNYEIAPHALNQHGQTTAELIGGNLSIICNSIGTSSEIKTKGKILFLEEVGEYFYHLDRMLVQLKRAGKLDDLAGVIIGDFSSMKDHKDSFGADALEVISRNITDLNIPIAYGFPLGHEKSNLPVYCGVPTDFEVSEKGVNLKFEV